MLQKLLMAVLCLFAPYFLKAQLEISSVGTQFTIDFNTSLSGVNSGAFQASGLTSSPTSGQLNSNAWRFTGFSDGDTDFGESHTSGDFSRGTSTGGIGTSGMYAFEVSPSNFALGVQATGSDFTPGTIELKAINTSTSTLKNITFSYDVWVYNDQNKSSSITFQYKEGNGIYQSVVSFDFFTPAAEDLSPTWQKITRSITLTQLNLAPNDSILFQWSSNDAGGSGSRDEWSLDNISLKAAAVAVPTDVKITNYSSERMQVSWDAPTAILGTDYDGVLVFLANDSSTAFFNNLQADGANFNGNSNYGVGSSITVSPSLQAFCVANSTSGYSQDLTVQQLTKGETYYLFAIAYREVAGLNNDLFSTPVFGGGQHAKLEEITQLTSSATHQKITLNWENPTSAPTLFWDSIVVFVREGSSVESAVNQDNLFSVLTPHHFESFTNWNLKNHNNDVFNVSGSSVGTDNTNYSVYVGTGNSLSVTGLTNSTPYHFRVFTFFSADSNRWSVGKNISATPTFSASTYLQQDFETVPATPTLHFTSNGSASSGNGVEPSAPKFAAGQQGWEFNNLTGELLTDTINALQLTDISVSFRLAAFGVSASSGLDVGDFVAVDVSQDGGNSFSEELIVRGNYNARWSFSGGTATASATFDGDNTPTLFEPSSGGFQTTEGFSTVTLAGLPNAENLLIRLRIVNNDANEFWVIDDLQLSALEIRPQIELSQIGSALGASNVNQAATQHLLTQSKLVVSEADVTLNSLNFETFGNYLAGAQSDLLSFSLYLSSDSIFDATDSLLAETFFIPASGNPLLFDQLSLLIPEGTAAHFFLTTDIRANATPGNTFGVEAAEFEFIENVDINANNLTGCGLQTILSATAEVVLSENSGAVFSLNASQIAQKHALSSFRLSVTNANAQFTELDISWMGSNNYSAFSTLQLWYSTDSVFDASQAQLVSSIIALSGTNNETFDFSGSQLHLIPENATHNFFITADFTCSAVPNDSFAVLPIAVADLSFNASPTISGNSIDTSAFQFVVESVPTDAQQLEITQLNGALKASWQVPNSGCFTDYILVVDTQSIVGTPSGTYSANSADFTDALNPTWASGAKVVFSGAATTETVSGLVAGEEYFFKVFTKNGNTWETVGIEKAEIAWPAPSAQSLLITAIFDGPRTGGTPKGVELYAVENISDLSYFAIGTSTNGNGSGGAELILTSTSLSKGEYYYVASESTEFTQFFGFAPNLTNGTEIKINGNDAVELFFDTTKAFNGNEIVIDVFGEINNTSSVWSYQDGWAARKNATTSNGSTFELSNWHFGNLSSGSAGSNSAETEPVPVQLYSELEGFVLTKNSVWSPSNAEQDATLNDVVTVLDSLIISGQLLAKELRIESGGHVEITANNSVVIDSALINNGGLTIKNSGSLLQNSLNDENSGNGWVNVERNSGVLEDDLRFQYWSSPIQNADMAAVFAGTNPNDWYSYQGDGSAPSWAPHTGNMQPGRGYTSTGTIGISNQSETRIFTGKVNNGSLSLSTTLLANDYILLGNPYPSAISNVAFFNDNPDLNGTLWLWNQSSASSANPNDYITWTAAGSTGGGAADFVGTAQGFMVQTAANLTSIAFNNSQRVTGNNQPFYSPNSVGHSKIWMSCVDSIGNHNNLLIALMPSATMGVDRMLDGAKIKGNPNLAFYSLLQQEPYSIQAIPPLNVKKSTIIPLGVDAWQTGIYQLRLDSLTHWKTNYQIELIDTQLDTIYDLTSTHIVSFDVHQTGQILNRFYLKLSYRMEKNDSDLSDSIDVVSSVPTENNSEICSAFYSHAHIFIVLESERHFIDRVQLVSIGGVPVFTSPRLINNRTYQISTVSFAKGTYLLKVERSDGTAHHHKIIIH